MSDSIKELQRVYQMLEDDESRFTYLNRLNYLVSGEFRFMDNIVKKYLPELAPWGSRTVEQILDELPKDNAFVLFGAGVIGAQMVPFFREDKRFLGFCSSTEEKQRDGFQGCPVMSPEELFARKDISVIISANSAQSEILELLQQKEYPKELVFTLEGVTVAYNDQYFGPEFMTYQEEVFVDSGCCNLRSSLALREHCPKVKKVYAFEPDPENYETCQRNKIKYHFPEVEMFPFGTWSEEQVLHFSANPEDPGTSCVSETGEITIPVKTIDEVVAGKEPVTFIKMDIEGSELESLKGAKNTIQRDKPKLAICIYHKPEDMTEIPLYIKSLVPEYKFYIRHHSNSYAETVLYAVLP